MCGISTPDPSKSFPHLPNNHLVRLCSPIRVVSRDMHFHARTLCIPQCTPFATFCTFLCSICQIFLQRSRFDTRGTFQENPGDWAPAATFPSPFCQTSSCGTLRPMFPALWTLLIPLQLILKSISATSSPFVPEHASEDRHPPICTGRFGSFGADSEPIRWRENVRLDEQLRINTQQSRGNFEPRNKHTTCLRRFGHFGFHISVIHFSPTMLNFGIMFRNEDETFRNMVPKFNIRR